MVTSPELTTVQQVPVAAFESVSSEVTDCGWVARDGDGVNNEDEMVPSGTDADDPVRDGREA